MAKHRKKDVVFNEHDRNQVKEIYKNNKKKKFKRRVKVLFFLVIVSLVIAFFISPLSRVKKITVIGNEDISTESIKKEMNINNQIYVFVNTSLLEEKILNMGFVKKANVSVDFLGNVKVEIDEASIVAYATIDKAHYLVDEMGHVIKMTKSQKLEDFKMGVQLADFKDLDFLKEFAKEYVKIPLLIRNQVSDIIYAPKNVDKERVEFIMDNGKILYLRANEMAEKLDKSVFDYDAYMTEYNDYCTFSFEGGFVYMSKCK